jgi:hypothetical protein
MWHPWPDRLGGAATSPSTGTGTMDAHDILAAAGCWYLRAGPGDSSSLGLARVAMRRRSFEGR